MLQGLGVAMFWTLSGNDANASSISGVVCLEIAAVRRRPAIRASLQLATRSQLLQNSRRTDSLALRTLGRKNWQTLAALNEKIVAHQRIIHSATHVRSTLILSSVNSLKDAGHFDRYVELLDPVHRDAVLQTLAPTWLPLDVGLAHYGACDALKLDAYQLRDIGERVGDRIQGTFLSTLTRGVRAAGITPWSLLNHFDRLWNRLFQGGSVELTRKGPKDVTIEVRSAVIPRFEYFRVGFSGVVRNGFKFVGVANPYVNIVHWDDRKDEFKMHAAWV